MDFDIYSFIKSRSLINYWKMINKSFTCEEIIHIVSQSDSAIEKKLLVYSQLREEQQNKKHSNNFDDFNEITEYEFLYNTDILNFLDKLIRRLEAKLSDFKESSEANKYHVCLQEYCGDDEFITTSFDSAVNIAKNYITDTYFITKKIYDREICTAKVSADGEIINFDSKAYLAKIFDIPFKPGDIVNHYLREDPCVIIDITDQVSEEAIPGSNQPQKILLIEPPRYGSCVCYSDITDFEYYDKPLKNDEIRLKYYKQYFRGECSLTTLIYIQKYFDSKINLE